jgi:hypothetical protein
LGERGDIIGQGKEERGRRNRNFKKTGRDSNGIRQRRRSKIKEMGLVESGI